MTNTVKKVSRKEPRKKVGLRLGVIFMVGKQLSLGIFAIQVVIPGLEGRFRGSSDLTLVIHFCLTKYAKDCKFLLAF